MNHCRIGAGSALLCVMVLTAGAAVASAQLPGGGLPGLPQRPAPPPPATAEMLADVQAIAPGSTFRLAVRITPRDDWHVYWKNPGDSGIPTEVEFDLPEGFEAGELNWPLPERFTQPGDLVGYGHSRPGLWWIEVRAPANLQPGQDVSFGAFASWLGCREICIPGEAAMDLALPTVARDAPPAPSQHKPAFDQAAAAAPIAAGHPDAPFGARVQTRGGGSEAHVSLLLDWAAEAPDQPVQWMPAAGEAIDVRNVSVRTAAGRTSIRFLIRRLGPGPVPESMESLILVPLADDRVQAVRVDIPLRAIAPVDPAPLPQGSTSHADP